MDRKAKILEGLDYRGLRGLEIGPLAWPLVSKSEGDIRFIDFMDADGLRKKYKDDPAVDVSKIVEVDYLWSGQPGLQDVVGSSKFDYVIASHVVEHVPNLVSWLTELLGILKPAGEVRLVVPDRRFTFDYLRQETVVAEVIAAWLEGRRVSSPRAIIDMIVNFVPLDRLLAWNGARPKVQRAALATKVSSISMAREAIDQGIYHDVHSWVFTPKSFASLMSDLAGLGILMAECTGFHDTVKDEFEFFVGLKHTDQATRAIESWAYVARQAAPAPWEPDVPPAEGGAGSGSTSAERLAAVRAERDRLAEMLAASRNEVQAIRASTSWQVTAPFRRVKTVLTR